MAGKEDLAGVRLEEIILSAGLAEVLRSAVSTGTPQWGTCPDSGRIFCCVAVTGQQKGPGAILVSLLNTAYGSHEQGNSISALQGAQAADIFSMLPHGLAVCDCDGDGCDTQALAGFQLAKSFSLAGVPASFCKHR